MISLSHKPTRFTLLGLNVTIIVFGISLMIYGIVYNVTSPKEVDPDTSSDGVTSIIAGCIDIATGVCGVVGIVLRKRYLIIVSLVNLCCTVIINLSFVVALSIGLSRLREESQGNLQQQVAKQYGVNSDPELKDFTLAIDEHQHDDDCCGWSANEGKNVFLASPWFKEINKGNNGDTARTLPSSCCLVADERCHHTSNIQQARDQGHVRKYDCINKIMFRAKLMMWSSIGQMGTTGLVQAACAVLTVLCLLKWTEE